MNLSLNALRDRKTRLEVPLHPPSDDGTEPPVVSRSGNPTERLETGELAEAVRKAMESLPESQRTVVILRRYERLSYQEIAEVTGSTVPAVKSLLSRARQNLKSLLRKYL